MNDECCYHVPSHLDRAVRDMILPDLEPSPVVVHVKSAIATVVGSLASLAVCGQFGIGLTSWAESFSATVHRQMDPVACALICGALFAFFPVAILRFALCRVIQFRALLHGHIWVLASWIGSVGSVIAWLGHHGDNALPFGVWLLAAVGTTYLCARLLSQVVFRSSVRALQVKAL